MSSHAPDPPDSEAVYRDMAAQVMVELARDLRQRMTNVEAVMWQALRGRRLAGLKFRRQHPIAGTAFVADFLCFESQLVIEIDGSVHATQQREDIWRQSAIEDAEYQVLRFSNEQVLNDLPAVLAGIHCAALAGSPRPEGEGPGVRAAYENE